MEENTSKVFVGVDPLSSMAPGAGSALFVINLCASIAPVDAKSRNLPGLENYRLYQVARVEDGRTRHRLRLGFFTSESHAESVLTMVRQQYPSAFTTCLLDEDRRFARGYLPQAAPAAAAPASRPVPVATAAAAPSVKPSATVAPKAAAATAPAAQARATPAPARAPEVKPAAKAPAPKTPAEVVEVSWTPEPAAKKVQPAEVTLDDLSWEPPALKPAEDDTASTAKHPVLSAVHKTQPVIKAPVAKAPAPAPKHTPAPTKVDTGASMRIKALDLTFSDPPAPPAPKKSAPSNEPFHVGKGVSIGELEISLQAETPAKAAKPELQKTTPAPRAPVAPPPKPDVKATPPSTPIAAKSAAPSKAAPPPKVAPPASGLQAAAKAPSPPADLRLPDLDSTQTIRALTTAELSDDSQEKWFAIQLAASEQPVNLDAMPHLDIFEAYRLYSVATAGSGKIVHSLRLGFFKEAVSAEAVSGYLKTFFSSPSVLRISVAEYARFKDAPSPKRNEDERSPAKVVELSDARASRPAVPTVTMEVPTPRTDATGSFRMSDTGGLRANDTGSFKPNATGSFKTSASGSHKVLTPTLKPAAKAAGVATKRAEPPRKTGATGKFKALPKKSLSEQLLDEAREVELSESGIRKLPKGADSLLSKLVGKLTK